MTSRRCVIVLSFLLTLARANAQPQPAAQVYRVPPETALSAILPSSFSSKSLSDRFHGKRPDMLTFTIVVNDRGGVDKIIPVTNREDAEIADSLRSMQFDGLSLNGQKIRWTSTLGMCFSESFDDALPCAPEPSANDVRSGGPTLIRILGPASEHYLPSPPKGWKLHGANPIYPAKARSARIQGEVLVRSVIDGEGSVVECKVLSGPPMLYDISVAAVKTWQYKPFLWGGRPVPVEVDISINYTLRG